MCKMQKQYTDRCWICLFTSFLINMQMYRTIIYVLFYINNFFSNNMKKMFLITKSPVASGIADRICFCISVTIWSPHFTLWESVCLDCAVFIVIAVSQCENVMYLLWITFCNMWIVAMRKEWNIYHLCAICHKMSCSRKK